MRKPSKTAPSKTGNGALLRNEAAQVLKGLRPDIGLDEADRLRPLTHNKKWIFALAHKHGLLNQGKETAAAALRDAQDPQEAIKNDLARGGHAPLDLSRLKAAVAAARKAGDLEQRLADSRKRASDGKAACEGELSRLGKIFRIHRGAFKNGDARVPRRWTPSRSGLMNCLKIGGIITAAKKTSKGSKSRPSRT